MKKACKSRIGRKLVVSVILFSSFITLVTTSIHIYLDYRQRLDEIKTEFYLIEYSFLPSLINSLWVYDEKQIQVQLIEILGLPGMEHLEIRHKEKISWSAGSITSKRLIKKRFPLVHHEDRKGIPIGSLLVVNSLDRVYDMLIDRAITILISNGIKIFLVAGFMLLLFHYLVTRRLLVLAVRLGRFSVGGQEAQQNLKAPVQGKDDDEVDQIVIAANTMQKRITTTYDEVQRSEKRFRKLISQMSAGFALHEIIVNDDGIPIDYRYLEVNDSFEKLTGLKRAEIIGRTVLDILPQTERYWIETGGKVALTGKSVVYKNFSKEIGKYFEIIAYSPQRNQFATIIMDISERKQAEEELKQHRDHLEELVRERTAELEIKNQDLERMNDLFVGREFRIKELRDRVKKLELQSS